MTTETAAAGGDGRHAMSPLAMAFALALAAAVSLGITRFAYGLLLPAMRADLGWSYTLAGSMNTVNAFGYFAGALMTPLLLRRFKATGVMIAGSLLASLFMAASGFFTDTVLLLLQRWLAGVASAWVFICGGVLAARLGSLAPARSGLLLGIYYGGSGLGITVSALLVPSVLGADDAAARWLGFAPWAWAWWALALACLLATGVLATCARAMQPLVGVAAAGPSRATLRWRNFGLALAGYGMFGIGYIGYMTFVIALLREQGASTAQVMLFYSALGVACMASSRIWAGLLDRHRSGRALATLNALLGAATLLPALTPSWPAALLSGIVFGGVFLSVVASTTAFVRHNLAAADWPAGISAFTTVFAVGQIVGPVAVGAIADWMPKATAAEGLAQGLLFSAVILWLGALLASRQRALSRPR